MSNHRLTCAVLALLSLVLVSSPGQADSVKGEWSKVFDWPIVAIHMVQLHTGEILIWNDDPDDDGGGDQKMAYLLDPAGECWEKGAGCFTAKPNPINIFCAGHAQLDNGSILVNGGHVRNDVGRPETFLFEYDWNLDHWNWTAVGEIENAHFARWYPTLTTLTDGTVLNVSGSEKRCSIGPLIGRLCERHSDCGPSENEDCKVRLVEKPEIFDPVTREWTLLSTITESVEYYPFNFVGPDGNVFFAGADSGAGGYDVPPTHSHTFEVVDAEALTPGPFSAIAGGSAVMYEPGKILKSGGTKGGSTHTQAEIINLNSGAPVWEPTGDMKFPRRRHNLTVLPDGTVLTTGGTRKANKEFEIEKTCGGTDQGAVCSSTEDCPGDLICEYHPMGKQLWVAEAEIWDPKEGVSGEWKPMAANLVPRMYHSTAMLLPDGRVLSAGGGPRGYGGAVKGYPNSEIFSPPYLFTGTPRPTINQAPKIIHYGKTFEVTSPGAGDVDRVSLIRLAAVTHSFDQNRRFVPLTFNLSGDRTLDIHSPLLPSTAPPGYYMLFLVSSEGVPSVARFVRLLPADPGAGEPFEYSAKVVCGVQGHEGKPRLARGHYSTSVNIHNPGPGPVRFFKKLALTYPPGDQRTGEVLPIGWHQLGYDEALQSDCSDLRRRLLPGGSAPIMEGFLVLQSHQSLDVSAVYTTTAVDENGTPSAHSSIDVERIAERDLRVDLQVEKTATVFPLDPQSPKLSVYAVLYSIKVRNKGPQQAKGVKIGEELRLIKSKVIVGELMVLEDPIFLPQGGDILNISDNPDPDSVSFDLQVGDLSPGDNATIYFWVIFSISQLPVPGEPNAFVANTATVDSQGPEISPLNNTITITTHLYP